MSGTQHRCLEGSMSNGTELATKPETSSNNDCLLDGPAAAAEVAAQHARELVPQEEQTAGRRQPLRRPLNCAASRQPAWRRKYQQEAAAMARGEESPRRRGRRRRRRRLHIGPRHGLYDTPHAATLWQTATRRRRHRTVMSKPPRPRVRPYSRSRAPHRQLCQRCPRRSIIAQ